MWGGFRINLTGNTIENQNFLFDENRNYAEMACEMSDDVSSRINREIDEWLIYNTDGTVVLLDVS